MKPSKEKREKILQGSGTLIYNHKVELPEEVKPLDSERKERGHVCARRFTEGEFQECLNLDGSHPKKSYGDDDSEVKDMEKIDVLNNGTANRVSPWGNQ